MFRNEFSAAGPYEDVAAFRQFERDNALERQWSDVLWAATREADRKTACLIETDSLDIDHDRQQVTFAWSGAVDSIEPVELAKALRLMAATIESEVQR